MTNKLRLSSIRLTMFNSIPKTNKISFFTALGIVLLILVQHFRYNTWDNEPKANSFDWDNFGYYLYLPAILENNDLATLEVTSKYFESQKPSNSFYQVMHLGDESKPLIVYPMGIAYFYAIPYIGVKAVMSLFYENHSSFDRPFHVVISLWCLFFILFCIALLRRILLRFFSDKVTALSLLLLIFGTNTFFYMAYFPQIVHPILFGFYVIFLYLMIKWHENPSLKNGLFLGLCFSFCMLLRPSSFFLIPLFLFWDIQNFGGFWKKIKWLIAQYKSILLLTLSGFILTIPQLLYWKMQSNEYLFFSYSVDWFDFTQPQLWNGLFGYRAGWIFHHPFVLVCLLGLILLIKSKTKYGLAILIASIFQIWFVLSWSNYWYGSGFGHRGFTEFQVFFVFVVALIVKWLFNKNNVLKYIGVGGLMILASVGVIRIIQYNQGIWGMPNLSPQYANEYYLSLTKESVDFSKLYTNDESDETFKSRVINNPGLFESHYSYVQDFSYFNHPYVIETGTAQGKAFQFHPDVLYNPTSRIPYITLNQKPGSGVEISVLVNNLGDNNGKKAFIVFEVSDKNNHTKYLYSSTPIIFDDIPVGTWTKVSNLKELLDLRFKDDIYSIYIYNPEGCKFLADDIKVLNLKYNIP